MVAEIAIEHAIKRTDGWAVWELLLKVRFGDDPTDMVERFSGKRGHDLWQGGARITEVNDFSGCFATRGFASLELLWRERRRSMSLASNRGFGHVVGEIVSVKHLRRICSLGSKG